jgi:transcriptional regulator with XRE-family HTH domain
MNSSPGVALLFAANLVHARKRAGISQEELGIRASLHRTEVSLLEQGTRLPRIDTLVKLAGGLAISPDELLVGIAWKAGGVRRGGFGVASSAESEDRSA